MSRPTLALEAIRVATRKLSRVPAADLDVLAEELGGRLPPAYRAYLERFGRGTFTGVLYVHAPEGVRAMLEEHRQHRTLSYASQLWSNFDGLHTPTDRDRLRPIARSMDGDIVYFHLDEPSWLVITPRHRPEISVVESFEEALAWFSASGVYWRPAAAAWFDSEIERTEHEIAFDGDRIDDVFALLHERRAAIAADAEVVDDVHGNPELVFVPSADGVIQLFDQNLRITADRGAPWLAAAVREMLVLGDVPPARFVQRR